MSVILAQFDGFFNDGRNVLSPPEDVYDIYLTFEFFREVEQGLVCFLAQNLSNCRIDGHDSVAVRLQVTCHVMAGFRRVLGQTHDSNCACP